jgi:GTP-binding nuclear protein Ran
MHTRKVKLLIVGDAGVGKTNFIQVQTGGKFDPKYSPTMGIEEHSLPIATSYGEMVFNLVDTPGQEKLSESKFADAYKGADCAIIMFDLTSVLSAKSVSQWYHKIVSICGDIPIALVGTKSDIPEKKVRVSELGLPYFELSSKGNNKDVEPLMWVACAMNKRH